MHNFAFPIEGQRAAAPNYRAMKAGPSHRREGNLKRQGGHSRASPNTQCGGSRKVHSQSASLGSPHQDRLCVHGWLWTIGRWVTDNVNIAPSVPCDSFCACFTCPVYPQPGAGTLQSYEVPVYTAPEEHNTPFVHILSKDACNFKGKV